MILEIEDKSSDFFSPALKITPQTDSEIFEVGIIAGMLDARGAKYTFCNGDARGRFIRVPVTVETKAK